VPRGADTAAPGRRGGSLAIVLGAALWGTAGATQELGAPSAAPVTVAGVRTLAGGALFLVVLLLLGRGAALRRAVRVAPRALLLGAAAMAVFQVGYLTGVRGAGVALGTLLAIGSAPVWAGAIAALSGRSPSRRWLLASLVTITGTAVLLLAGEGVVTGAGDPRLGAGAALLAGAAYAVIATATKRALDRGADGTATVAGVFLVSGVLLAPTLVLGDLGWLATPGGLVAAGWLAIGPTVAGYVLYAHGLRQLDAPTATSLTLAEPLTATVLAVVVVGERPTAWSALGAALLLAGLALLSVRPPGGGSSPVGRPDPGEGRGTSLPR
jgi:drug/metabolite transporter, DME family